MNKHVESESPVSAPISVRGDWVSPYTAQNGPLGALLSSLNNPTPEALGRAQSDVEGVLQSVRALMDFVAMVRLERPDLTGNDSEVMALNGLASDLTGVCIDALAATRAARRDLSGEDWDEGV